MRWFRRTLCESRFCILALLAVEFFYMVDGRNFVQAHQVHEQEEARLRELSDLLDVPVEKLRPDHETLFDSIKRLFVEAKDPVMEAGLKRLREVLKKHEEQVAANPYLPQIEAVKREHAIYRIEGLIQDLMQFTEPRGGKALPEASQRALLRNLHHGLKGRLELPPLPEGSPAKAQAKHAEMQAKLDRLFDSVRPIVAETQQPQTNGTLAQKVGALRTLQAVDTKRSVRPPRFADRPLPLRRVEKKARTLELPGAEQATEISPRATAPSDPPQVVSKAGIAPEIVELAESLGNSPARIFSFVHDNVDFDPKWGAFKGPLGTLWERSGTSWDQAWLLRDLLVAAGVDARFEWGEIEVSTELLTNITGLDDPFRAGDLMTTAGVPIVLLTEGSRVVAARMSHVWVRAFVDYIPNRGATPGPGDKWIRMDPSLKRYSYAPGIPIHHEVAFSLGDYLQSGTELSPRRAHEEALWAYIRANGIQCTTLEQLKKAGGIIEEAFPFLPGTLRGKILRNDGEESGDPPLAFQERIAVEVRKARGDSLLVWTSPLPSLYGERIEIGYEGATTDDKTVLDANGGVFSTPPYLVDLKPVIRLDGVELAEGSAIGSAEDVEIVVTLQPANGPSDVFVHEGYAGEPGVLVSDFGQVPQQVVSRHQEVQAAAAAAGDAAALEPATLQLLGTTYLQNLGRDADDIAGWTWHRLVRLVSEGLVVQTGDVTTTVGGSPLSFTEAETFVDFPGFVVGLFHDNGTPGIARPTLELAGAQGSFLEGEVFDQVVAQEGIAAVSALTQARREGQTVEQVDAANVDAVLAARDLGENIEAQVRLAVGQGRMAWIPERLITVNLWRGVGFVLADPTTGAAGYLLDGSFAGGAGTGPSGGMGADTLGDEEWLSNGFLADRIERLYRLVGGEGFETNSPQTNQGDPVNMATGNLWLTETDLRVQAPGLPIIWARTYNSRSDFEGPLGSGWTFNFGEHLEPTADGGVLYREQDGTEHRFTAQSGDLIAPPGLQATLVSMTDGWTLSFKDGTVSRFAADGRLLSLSDSNGSTLTMSYDGDGLTSVKDATGRTVLTLERVDGRIARITDVAGRTVIYGYQDGNMTTVTAVDGEVWSYAYDRAGNLIASTDPLGATDTWTYDSFDRCIAHVDPLGVIERFLYPRGGRSAAFVDKRGFERYFEFDESGRALLEVDPLGNASSSTWDDDNNRLTVTDPRGNLNRRIYDDRGNLLSETDSLGRTSRYTWDTLSRPLTITDPLGGERRQQYDGQGNLIRREIETSPGNLQAHTFEVDGFGRVTLHRDPLGRERSLRWDVVNGALLEATDSVGNSVTYSVDVLGRPILVTDPQGHTASLGWDDADRIATVVDFEGNRLGFRYDAAGRHRELDTADGTVRFDYDALGRLVATTDAAGTRRQIQYDAGDRPVALIDGLGHRTTMTYDALGRLTARVDSLGHVWTFGYCANLGGSPDSFCERTDPLGNTVSQTVDEAGRIIATTDAMGSATTLAYDSLDRVSSVSDALGRTTHYEYDFLGQATAVVEPDGSRTEYDYDPVSGLTSVLDAEGREWQFAYDVLGQLVSWTNPLGESHTATYDELGNLSTLIRPDGTTLSYEYTISRRTRVHLPGGGEERYEYDMTGRLILIENAETSKRYEYDSLGRLTRAIHDDGAYAVSYTYDAAGRCTRIVTPKATIDKIYDAAGRLVEQRDSQSGIFLFEYDGAGRRTATRYPNGWVTRDTYDAAGNLTLRLTSDLQENIVDGYRYTYDAAGNRVAMRSLREGVEHTYQYDANQRLIRWQRGADHVEEYGYDRVGNRVSLNTEERSVLYEYDDANRLLAATSTPAGGGVAVVTRYGWDALGNLVSRTRAGETTTYDWDPLGRLLAVHQSDATTAFGYDANGTRVRESVAGDETRFRHIIGAGGFDYVSAEEAPGGTLKRYTSHGPGFDEPLVKVSEGSTQTLARDGLGSVTAFGSADGERLGGFSYEAFGARFGDGESRWGFAGRETDPTGLMYYRARYYEPEVGRFISEDSVWGSANHPASLNRYAYVENDPINRIDPSGNSPVLIAGIAFLFLGAQFFYLGMLANQQGADELVLPIGLFGVAYTLIGLFLITLHIFFRKAAETFEFLWALAWSTRVVQYRLLIALFACMSQALVLLQAHRLDVDIPPKAQALLLVLTCLLVVPLAV